MKETVLYPELSYALTGILFLTHNELGKYCNEQQYGDKIESELHKANIVYEREKILPISFEGEQAGRNKVDFLVADRIILELKAKRILTREDYYQVKRYLAALDKQLGILVNFRAEYIVPKRILHPSHI
ncbi:MAG: GxxExxY protein [Candidatus Wildermuthbacteria bacterium]|nr:GxxExxY protein [Candidatus Wildermuthbacteria bacterium]